MKEKNQLISKIKRLREEAFRLEKQLIVLKAMLQSGEAELAKRKEPTPIESLSNSQHNENKELNIQKSALVPLITESK